MIDFLHTHGLKIISMILHLMAVMYMIEFALTGKVQTVQFAAIPFWWLNAYVIGLGISRRTISITHVLLVFGLWALSFTFAMTVNTR
ncbi:MAG: hypothetical protein WC284_18065 [Candidimonas sp.]